MKLTAGDQVRLDPDPRRWWTMRAVSEHFAVCVRQVAFQPRGTFCYTVLDWRNGVRGPCNLIGQGYGDGSYSEQECAQMLKEFEGLEEDGRTFQLEVSHRNRVPLDVTDRRTP